MITVRVWLCLVGLGMLLLPAALLYPSLPARAQDLPPRPTRQPTAVPSVEPTPRPSVAPTVQPGAEPTARPRRRKDDDDDDAAPPRGLITGTVIDEPSGQPVAGVGVRVGTVIVLSDANGNYTRDGLKAGVYQVTLAPAQGMLVGGPFEVQLTADASAIQHLRLRRPPPRTQRP